MTFGRRLVAAAVCVPLLVVGGCADDPEPEVAPPTPTPTSPSPSATPTPEPWEKKTNAGAVAFAKHWVDVFNEAQRTGDTASMRELSARTCGSCSRFAKVLEDLYGDGGSLESDGWAVLQVGVSDRVANSRAAVAMRLRQSAQEIRRGDGEAEKYPGGKISYSARLVWSANEWTMGDLVLIQ